MKMTLMLALIGCVALSRATNAAPALPCIYEYEMEIWRVDAMLKGNPMDHTATRTRIYKQCGETRTLFDVVDKCNHGTCPGGNAWPTDAPPDYRPVFKKKYEPIKGEVPETGVITTGSVISTLINTIGKERSHESPAQTNEPLRPVGCDYYGYKTLTRPDQIRNYGLTGERHVCNNDTFLQMGQVITGKMPSKTTVTHICENQHYTDFTGRDPKYMPTFKNVQDFVKKWGWAAPARKPPRKPPSDSDSNPRRPGGKYEP